MFAAWQRQNSWPVAHCLNKFVSFVMHVTQKRMAQFFVERVGAEPTKLEIPHVHE
jgi:hypothetical protein